MPRLLYIRTDNFSRPDGGSDNIPRKAVPRAPQRWRLPGIDVAIVKMTVLLVDDNASVRKLLRRLLSQIADQVVECADGAEAAAMYAACQPDIVLMDVKMQQVDGLTATREIRRLHPAARIVMVTDYDDDELRVAAREAGACEYVVKKDLTKLKMIVSRSATS
jgi:CheY-like chemotaxis protein